ncbi:MAG: helix-turn-helix domain-containing protein [Caldilineaceae bacterium]|nr:helix-turn-helix domain-containing protein [Caldilineaceae bacterium]
MNLSRDVLKEAEEFLSRSQVAELFNVAPSTITRWADAGKLNYVRTLGGHRRYQKESIVKLIRSLMQEEVRVQSIVLAIPQMYGDHHTSAVHRILAQLPGVQEVWASAARRQVKVTFDPDQVSAETIGARLEEAGYSPGLGQSPPATPSSQKDPVWAKMGVRMTQTHPTGA